MEAKEEDEDDDDDVGRERCWKELRIIVEADSAAAD